jgi:hypothetical protein
MNTLKAPVGSLPWVAVACLAMGACSNGANLSGDVFITTSSGDVKRGGDVEVVLVAATDEFAGKWKLLIEEFRVAYEKAAARYEEAVARERHGSNEEHKALLGAMKPGLDTKEFYRYMALSRERGVLLDRTLEEKRRARAVVADYTGRGMSLLRDAAQRRVRTNVDGHYELKDVGYGKYLLAAEYVIGGTTYRWTHEITVEQRTVKADLTASNSNWPIQGDI